MPIPLLPLSSTANLITVIFSTIYSLSINYPVSSRSRTLLLLLSLKLLSPVISLSSYALSTGSESWNASNTSFSHLPTKFLQLPNFHTFITSSLFNVLAVYSLFIRRHSCSATIILSKITDRSFRYASPCLWNQLPLSLRQSHSGTSCSIFDSLIPSPITSSSSISPLCTSITPSLFHSRLKTYLFHKSYPVVLVLPPGLPSRTIAWIVSSELYSVFYFLSLFFVSGPCARLIWPSRQLLSAR